MRCFTRSWLFFGVVAYAVLAAGAYWLTYPRLSITKETCAKIRPGMTRAEVEALIGGPAGDYTTELIDAHWGSLLFWAAEATQWTSDWGEICVEFDPEGRVREARFFSVVKILSDPPGFLERMCARLGW